MGNAWQTSFAGLGVVTAIPRIPGYHLKRSVLTRDKPRLKVFYTLLPHTLLSSSPFCLQSPCLDRQGRYSHQTADSPGGGGVLRLIADILISLSPSSSPKLVNEIRDIRYGSNTSQCALRRVSRFTRYCTTASSLRSFHLHRSSCRMREHESTGVGVSTPARSSWFARQVRVVRIWHGVQPSRASCQLISGVLEPTLMQ